MRDLIEESILQAIVDGVVIPTCPHCKMPLTLEEMVKCWRCKQKIDTRKIVLVLPRTYPQA